MDFRILGPISFEVDGEEVVVRPQAALFVALMLVSERQRVSNQEFAALVGKPKENASNSIRQIVHVLQETSLRQYLDKAPRGYRGIRVVRSAVDYLRFRDLVDRAEREDGDGRRLALREALDEWDGVPLTDLSTPGAERLRARLVDEHRRARLGLIESLADAGEFDEASEEALLGLGVSPRDETFIAMRVHLLRVIGREGRAREDYERWAASAEGPIPDFDAFAAGIKERFAKDGSMRVAAHRPAPSQLPNCRLSLIGRDRHYAELDRALLAEGEESTRLVAITGMPAVGKSTLAINWAHANRSAFDGVLYADLEGFAAGEPRSPESVLARFLDELGMPDAARDQSTATSAYRSAVAIRRLLVVIDNVRNAEHARLLLPGPGGSAAIVTSRDELAGLVAREGARWVPLRPLEVEDGASLLRREIRDPRDPLDPYLNEVAEFCGGLPLALLVAVATANTTSGLTVRDLALQLRVERNRLDALGHRDPDLNLRVVFGHSYRSLTPPARRLLERVAIHPGPTVGMAALAALNDHDARATKLAVDELRDASLIETASPRRYRLHDVTRDFACMLAAERDPAEVERVRRDALDYLLFSAAECDFKLDSERLLPIDRGEYRHAFVPAGVDKAMDWFRDEQATLMAAIRCAEQEGLARYLWLLPLILVTYKWRTHGYLELRPVLESAAGAAHEVASPADEATVHRMIAGTLRNLYELPLARGHLAVALRLARSTGDVLGIARTQHLLASFHLESRPPDLEAATDCLNEALAAFEEVGNAVGSAGARAGLCSVRFAQGDHAEAERLCDEASRAYRQQGDQSGEANMARQRGRIKAAQGDLDRALAEFRAAEHVYHSMGYGHREADVLVERADLLIDMERADEAHDALAGAREIYSGLEHTDAKIDRVDAYLPRLR